MERAREDRRLDGYVYPFGAFLVFTGVRMFTQRNKEAGQGGGTLLRWLRRVVPSSDTFDGDRFFTVKNGRRLATPLFLSLVLVELTDVVFALDSIPAIFAITADPFIVFTSNIFAILGLRSLFFLMAGLAEKFRYLKVGLAAVLVFVGIKMAAVDLVKVPPFVSLAIIAMLLGASIVASIWRARALGTRDSGPGENLVREW